MFSTNTQDAQTGWGGRLLRNLISHANLISSILFQCLLFKEDSASSVPSPKHHPIPFHGKRSAPSSNLLQPSNTTTNPQHTSLSSNSKPDTTRFTHPQQSGPIRLEKKPHDTSVSHFLISSKANPTTPAQTPGPVRECTHMRVMKHS